MRHHTHLTLEEREEIMCLHRSGKSLGEIASLIGRDKSTISREISRNSCVCFYRASTAQRAYDKRRSRCKRRNILDNEETLFLIADKLLHLQWSPEQVEGRLKLEGGPAISDSTIYRGIAKGRFDKFLSGQKKASCRLRHKGKKRKRADEERRGKIKISHEISERPAEVEARSNLGDWEGDTVMGRPGGACLVTLVDRKSGFLVGGKAKRKRAEPVRKAMARALRHQPCNTITLDRGKEFAEHAALSDALDVECYFALPHHPWQRGTNENTNGLIREYFPKGRSLDKVKASEVKAIYDKLNHRPRKRLGYRCPYEVHYETSLHLI